MPALRGIGLVLLVALALASGIREWWMAAAAGAVALWAGLAWWSALTGSPRLTVTATPSATQARANPPHTANSPDPAARWLWACAAAWALYFVLHAVRLDPAQGWARLDGPSRVVLLAPLLAVPWLLNLQWPTLRRLIVVAAWSLGLSSITYGLMQGEPLRNYGFFTFHNLAGYASVTLLGLLACTREEPAWRWWSRGGMALALLAALSAGTIGALIALPLVLAVAAWRWSRTGVPGLHVAWAVGLGLLVVLVVAAIAWPRIEARALFFLADWQSPPDPNGYNGSSTQRWAMWQVAWAMIVDSPWLGQGLHAFPSQMQPWADRLGLGVRFGIIGFGFGGYQNPHNLLLGWAATMGVPTAMLLVLLFFGVPLWVARQLALLVGEPTARVGVQNHARELLVALRLLLALLAVFCLTESVIERQRGMTWFAVWIALVLGTLAATVRRGHAPDGTIPPCPPSPPSAPSSSTSTAP